MGLRTKNTWGSAGSALDQQRGDLWTVDLGASVSNPSRPGYGTLYAALGQFKEERTAGIPKDGLEPFSTNISFPDAGITPEMFRQGNMPVNLPVADKVMEGVRLTFKVEVPKRGEVPALVNLLECWRDMARIGRGFGDGTIPNLINEKHQPTFRFDVRVKFLAGADKMARKDEFNDTTASSTQLPLRNSYTLLLRKAWCASVLYSEVSYADAKMVDVTCQIYPEYIEAVPERLEENDSNFISLRTGELDV